MNSFLVLMNKYCKKKKQDKCRVLELTPAVRAAAKKKLKKFQSSSNVSCGNMTQQYINFH